MGRSPPPTQGPPGEQRVVWLIHRSPGHTLECLSSVASRTVRVCLPRSRAWPGGSWSHLPNMMCSPSLDVRNAFSRWRNEHRPCLPPGCSSDSASGFLSWKPPAPSLGSEIRVCSAPPSPLLPVVTVPTRLPPGQEGTRLPGRRHSVQMDLTRG